MTAPLALTLGEPAGIGPDITLQAWLRRDALGLPAFYVLGDPAFLAQRAKLLDLPIPIAEVRPEQASQAFASALPVASTGHRVTALPGRPDATSAEAAIGSIRQAVADVKAGRAAAVVTNPIAKAVLYRAGFSHPGHTEFLAELAADGGAVPQPVMMLWSPTLAVVPVTIHVALRDAIEQLTSPLITSTTRIVAASLRRYFGVSRPRIAMSGLNPHAGEDGTLGSEEDTIIAPAIANLRNAGLDVQGPLPADTMFHEAARKSYDCAVCMYHDQALIPIKTLAFDEGVNVTLGLPFIRTSPDHGTAFAIAGKGTANPASLIAAVQLAARMASQSS
ncbi:4-hydroxythreonine-4-phosphate dehydrogenase PdxA [Bradyrhizobium sp. STM 3809]|uniref:4-hydroxythreonine-4-phosphate dehydrogenase PdxA n=1 Tax=Bradyrhizobium sp. STM 3809 TaxID=551936 RepID=UPI00024097BC|nr:4-hydroxythreonine-4-phosphate dehydrogenase PdxA [Bradyrhizobium sp. STM 3809]CCE01225.1 4-hydroxythreonine-4-phosphate dehydrogenase (4-(phosphohydroxy)-L-threonine dehydrogenase) [Bradyrhizobium sp. STM 3809]